jgi:hypothetical protein
MSSTYERDKNYTQNLISKISREETALQTETSLIIYHRYIFYLAAQSEISLQHKVLTKSLENIIHNLITT